MKTLQQASDIWQETNLSNDTRVRLTDFEGDVMAWSFGPTSGVISCPDFELVIPDMSRNVPALIGQSPSESAMVDGEVCLFHPVVTCLAGSGEIFNPPLLLRFSVGDAMESGSDVGSSNEDEEFYKADLRLRYSVVKREEGSSKWVPIVGEIKKMDNGVFVLETQVSHFTDYALYYKSLISGACLQGVGKGRKRIVEVKRPRNVFTYFVNKGPRNVFLFVNKGDKTVMVVYWRRPKDFYTSRVEGSVGAVNAGVSAAFDRAKLDTPPDPVYNEVVEPNDSAVLNISDTTSLEVAWATVEDNGDHRSVTVWGRSPLDHDKALVIGPLPEIVYAEVQYLEIARAESVSNKVREVLGSLKQVSTTRP